MAIQLRVMSPNPTGTGTRFYLWVGSVPDPNPDGYGRGYFFPPVVTHRTPKIKCISILSPAN
jgi:hypothetical protein